jgi:hypothetical protein
VRQCSGLIEVELGFASMTPILNGSRMLQAVLKHKVS